MQAFSHVDSALLAGLGLGERAEIEQQMTPLHLDAGTVLCRAGEKGSSLYLIRSGLLHAVNLAGEVLGRQRPGDVVGEAALLTGEPRSATLVARLPTEVLELSRDGFLASAARHPALLMNIAGIVSHRMVARTADRVRTDRGETVAVVTGRSGWPDKGAALAAATASSAADVSVIDLTGPERSETSAVLSSLEASRRRGGRVLVVVGSDHDDLLLLVDYCDRAVALMSATEAGQLSTQHRLPPDRLGPVPGRTRDAGWLGRHLAGATLGLALGAGGAKAFAHVGVIRVLERAGYVIDYVAGSSMGAWVGSWLALRRTADEIEQTLRSAFTEEAARIIFRVGAAGTPSGTAAMEQLARQTTGGADFGVLLAPLVVMTADLEDRRPAPLTTGPVHEALVAAMTVPGLYPPVQRGQQRLVDAVVLTPVPTAALIGAGADVTVAVNLLGREALPAWPGADPSPARPRRDRDTVVESLELAQVDASARLTALADVPVTPAFGPGTWRDFQLADRYIQAGETAMTAALPHLRTLTRPSKS